MASAIWSFTAVASAMALACAAPAHWSILSVMALGFVMNASITSVFEVDPGSFVVPTVASQIGR